MKFSATLATLSVFLVVGVQAHHQLPARYAGQRRGNQFVTGPCSVDSDCQQGCCGFSTGKCAGPAIAQANGSGGCGHGNAKPNCDVATLLGLKSQCIKGAVQGDLTNANTIAAANFAAKLDGLTVTVPKGASSSASSSSSSSASSNNPDSSSSSSGTETVAQLAAKQTSKKTVFETCAADTDCQQGCCGFSSAKCAGPAVAQTNGSGGCGHGNAKPNCDVATLLGFKSQCIAGVQQGNLNAATTQQAAAFAAQLDGITSFKPSVSSSSSSTASSSNNAGSSSSSSSTAGKSIAQLAALQTSKKTVFETCSTDTQCQQGCCGFSSGKCAGPAIAQANGSGGCGHGNAKPNCDVATLLGFKSQCIAGVQQGNLNAAATQQAAAFAAQLDNITSFKPS